MIIVITAGGPVQELPDLALWQEADFIGVDAGTLVLLEKGITPVAAVGDFDSVSSDELKKISSLFPGLQLAPAEKDETDTELALKKAMTFQPEIVIVTGVTGGRLDHYMSALHAIYSFQMKFPATKFLLVNRQNRIRFLSPGKHVIKRGEDFRFVSFYPFAEAIRGLSLSNFKYEVLNESIPFGSTRFISNELFSEGIVSIEEGSCIMIESRD
ncbi:thiamine diphosphokinase [Planococcus salinus]|uniref:Thiamine diphosphokinase n=1 Tax=Planococcus salinus TaxID=1848460 RepID=A0A3M8PBD8_9BACL|nr:thiamine diphosphokinase [Planococcus salinus]RNF40641.1 thiamine diphosphokinase [Planococcus salinus]